MSQALKQRIASHLQAHQTAFEHVCAMQTHIADMATLIVSHLADGKRIFLCGNGGSAADCQHIAAELVGRFKQERRALPAVALTTDTSALTAIGNDYGFEQVFARQLSGLAQPGDLVWVLSTSGNSANITAALTTAKIMGCTTLGLLGKDGGAALSLCDHALVVPHPDTAHVQEMHLMVYHMLCDAVDLHFANASSHQKDKSLYG